MDHHRVEKHFHSSLQQNGLTNIRASCDNCAKSKVRCSKDQPRCQRCIQQGVRCKYSPSQKYRRKTLCSSGIEPQPRHPLCHQVAEKISPCDNVSSSSLLLTPPSRNDPVQVPTPAVEACSDQFNEEEFRKTYTECGGSFLTPAHLLEADVDSFLKWDELDLSPRAQSSCPQHMTTLSDASLSQPLPLQQRLETYSMLDKLNVANMFPAGKGPAAPAQNNPHNNRIHGYVHHSCSRIAISAIQNLEFPSSFCSSTYMDKTTQSPTLLSRSLDKIVKDNRAAIDSLLTILKCSCTAQMDLIFLVATIALRVLAWYQASLDRCASNSRRSSNSGSVSPSTLSTPTTTADLQDRSLLSLVDFVFIPSITMGAYTLEAQHSDHMVAQLILAELAKMKEIIDIFTQKYCERGRSLSSLGPPRPSLGMREIEDRLFLELEAQLRRCLKQALLTTREQLDRH